MRAHHTAEGLLRACAVTIVQRANWYAFSRPKLTYEMVWCSQGENSSWSACTRRLVRRRWWCSRLRICACAFPASRHRWDRRCVMTDRRCVMTDRRCVMTDRRYAMTDRRCVMTDRRYALTDRRYAMTDVMSWSFTVLCPYVWLVYRDARIHTYPYMQVFLCISYLASSFSVCR